MSHADQPRDVCGFFFRAPPAHTPASDLDAFLAVGPPPIYIGFGSIVVDNPREIMSIIVNAVRSSGVRAVISKGWSQFGGSVDESIFFVGECPHEWLFPRVAAVVHHGGAGTTACGLKYGIPTVIIPFFGE